MGASFGLNLNFYVSISFLSVSFHFNHCKNNLLIKIGYSALLLSLCGVVAFAQTPHGDIFTDNGDCSCCPKETGKSNSLLEETVIADLESIGLESMDLERLDSDLIP